MVPAERLGGPNVPAARSAADPCAAALGTGAAVRLIGRGLRAFRVGRPTHSAQPCRTAEHDHVLHGFILRQAQPARVSRRTGRRDVLRGMLCAVARKRPARLGILSCHRADGPAAVRPARVSSGGKTGNSAFPFSKRAHPFPARPAGQRKHASGPRHRSAGDRAVRPRGAAPPALSHRPGRTVLPAQGLSASAGGHRRRAQDPDVLSSGTGSPAGRKASAGYRCDRGAFRLSGIPGGSA